MDYQTHILLIIQVACLVCQGKTESSELKTFSQLQHKIEF